MRSMAIGYGTLLRCVFFSFLMFSGIACTIDSKTVSDPIGSIRRGVVTNGSFEDGNLNGWTVTTYYNGGIKDSQGIAWTGHNPEPDDVTREMLNLTGSLRNLSKALQANTLQGVPYGLAPTGGTDPHPPRYPLPGSGSWVAGINEGQDTLGVSGMNFNVNALKQTMTISSGDVDSFDGRIHIRFVMLPILQNPQHPVADQPYYYAQVKNLSTDKVIFRNFKYSDQPGVPWKSVTPYTPTCTSCDNSSLLLYTGWEVVDISPSSGLQIGDNVEIEIIGAGCAQGGHWGEIYADTFGPVLPGLSISARASTTATCADADITYNFIFKNGGGPTSGNVLVDVTLPVDSINRLPTTFVSLSDTTHCSLTSATTVSCNFGPMASGTNGSFDMTVHVPAAARGTINLGTYIISDNGALPLLGPIVITDLSPYNIIGSSIPSAGGTVVCDSPVTCGASSTCTITPAKYCTFSSLSDNTVDVTGQIQNNQYIINNIHEDHAVVATFITPPVVSWRIDGGHGTMTCSPAIVPLGNSSTCTLTPDPGYTVGSLVDNGATVTGSVSNNTYVINNVQTDHLVVGVFAPPVFSISINVIGGHGAINCVPPSQISLGNSSICTAMPEEHYVLQILTDNTQDVISLVQNSTYTLSNIQMNHALLAMFKKDQGAPCTTSTECHTWQCVDGFCCNSTCSSQCQACDVAGSEGTCTSVIGAPHGIRLPCTTDGTLCGGACDGAQANACAYPDKKTQCHDVFCEGGVANLAAMCNGQGACNAAARQECNPFICGQDGCKTSCNSATDCIAGYMCINSTCVPGALDVGGCGCTLGSAAHTPTRALLIVVLVLMGLGFTRSRSSRKAYGSDRP